MTFLLALLSVTLAAIGALTPLLPALTPRIGLQPLYRMRLIRVVLLIVAWVLAIVALARTLASFVVLPFLLLFSILSALMEPRRIFVSLDDPEHVPASRADFEDEALVLGYGDDEQALAWLFETLAPRHLINDRIGDTPLLVAY